jgi:hypothetical protein
MEKLDNLVAEHIERRLLQPKRLEQSLSHILDRRTECAEEGRTSPNCASAPLKQTRNSSGSMMPSRMASPTYLIRC